VHRRPERGPCGGTGTSVLVDGQWVTVDGDTGRVTAQAGRSVRVSEPAGPPAEDHRRSPRRRAVPDAALLGATIAEIDETGYANPRK
jgi:hypothetical protein